MVNSLSLQLLAIAKPIYHGPLGILQPLLGLLAHPLRISKPSSSNSGCKTYRRR